MLQVRTHGFEGMSRTKKAAIAVALVAVGAVVLTLGLVLLLGLVAVGGVAILGILGYRRITGRRLFVPQQHLDADGPVRVIDAAADEPKPGEVGFQVRVQNDGYRRMISAEAPRDDDGAPR